MSRQHRIGCASQGWFHLGDSPKACDCEAVQGGDMKPGGVEDRAIWKAKMENLAAKALLQLVLDLKKGGLKPHS